MNRADRRKTAKANSDRIDEYVAAGLSALETGGNLAEAQQNFRQALVINPGHPEANMHMGNMEMWARRFPQAQQHFAVAYQANSQDPKVVNNLALSLHEQGLVAKALPLYEDALKLDPKNPAIRTNLARGLWNTGENERAQDEMKKSLEIDPQQGTGWLVLGSIQRSLNLREEAVSSMTKAIHLLPGHMEANFVMARLLFNPSDPDACLKPSEEIYRQHGDGTEAAMCRAELLYQFGKLSEAEEVLSRNLEVEDPSLRLNVLNVMANTKQALGETDEAINFHKKALQISIEHPITRYHYGRTLAQSGDYKGAISQFQTVTQQLYRDQSFIGYLAFAQKIVDGDENIKRDIENLLKESKVAPKEIYQSVDELNDAVLKSLTQEDSTPVHTLDRKRRVSDRTWESILGEKGSEPIVILGDLIRDAVIAYLADLPQGEEEHPFTLRVKFGMGATETWAETIKGSADFTFAVDRTGWFKAIYFVSVPDECADDEKKAGWLRLGVPDFGSRSDFLADAEIKPEAGKLVIFPAYYWSGFNGLSEGASLTYFGINGQSRAG